MITVNARATAAPGQPFRPSLVHRRDVGAHDVLIDIAYCGVCHSDIHHARNDFGKSIFPLVPGHEIVGTVAAAGPEVTRFGVGDTVGVGCMVDSCRRCSACRAGLEQYCHEGDVKTSNGRDYAGIPTDGGYSEKIVVDEAFVVRIPAGMALERTAPLLCAGATLYSALRHWEAGPGRRVGMIGFGGLGHIGTQISRALGAHTTVFDLSLANRDDGLRLGADEYVLSTDPAVLKERASSLDLIVSTVPVTLDLDAYLSMLDVDGTLVLIGIPREPLSVGAFSLLFNRRSIAGQLISGMPETQEMIDFCGEHGIGAEVEVIGAEGIDEAYRRLLASDVRYRFVIDVATMADPCSRGLVGIHSDEGARS